MAVISSKSVSKSTMFCDVCRYPKRRRCYIRVLDISLQIYLHLFDLVKQKLLQVQRFMASSWYVFLLFYYLFLFNDFLGFIKFVTFFVCYVSNLCGFDL